TRCASTCTPAARSSCAAASSASRCTSTSTRFMPRRAPRRAHSRPKPEPAPVSTAVLPLKSSIMPASCNGSDQLHQLLAKVLALEQAQEGRGRRSQALGHALARAQLAAGHQGAELLERLGPDVHMLADNEAFD